MQVEKIPMPVRLMLLNSLEILGELKIMVMPGMKVDRLKRITQMVEEWGDYPIDPARVV